MYTYSTEYDLIYKFTSQISKAKKTTKQRQAKTAKTKTLTIRYSVLYKKNLN